jgi:DNA helicase HerA-like ATPase
MNTNDSSALNIQIRRIESDLAELLFNPREVDLRVGETLTLHERESGRAVIVQIIAFRSATYPALAKEQMVSLVESPLVQEELLKLQMAAMAAEGGTIVNGFIDELGNIKLALAKLRKTVPSHNNGHSRWESWDGWIPARDVEVTRTGDDEVFANATHSLGNNLRLGRTLTGRDFFIEGQALEKVNVVTGVKGSGKSHLAKVILMQLIEHGAPCIVFDINREYIHLPKTEADESTGEIHQRGIVHLEAGGNFRLGVRQFGLAPLMTLMQRFGLPEVSALHFENRIARLWAEAEGLEEQGKKAPYLGLEQLMDMADDQEFGGGSSALVVNNAIRSRLEALANTRIFARSPREAASLSLAYNRIREGGALVIDISALSNLARGGFVQAIIELVKDLCHTEIENGTHRFPFIFFEEAHLYVSRQSIDYIVTRARHLGITSFFVTNMIQGLDEAILRQADNLFMLRIPYEDDVRHVSRGAATDFATMDALVRRLRQRHALVVGNVTSQYPLMFEVDPLRNINTAGETRYFFNGDS